MQQLPSRSWTPSLGLCLKARNIELYGQAPNPLLLTAPLPFSSRASSSGNRETPALQCLPPQGIPVTQLSSAVRLRRWQTFNRNPKSLWRAAHSMERSHLTFLGVLEMFPQRPYNIIAQKENSVPKQEPMNYDICLYNLRGREGWREKGT